MKPRVRCAAGWLAAGLLVACGGDPIDPCAECRGDQSCYLDACVPWDQVPLEVDFDLEIDGLTATCTAHPGGFPREHVQELRFTFGDEFAGHGESISHTYAGPGLYPIDLVVRLDGYRVLHASKLARVAGDTALASRVFLTVNRNPDYLNGSLPYHSDNFTPSDDSDDYDADFHLLLAPAGFTVDVDLLDADGREIDADSLVLTADQPLGDGAIPAGTDLADRLEPISSPVEGVRRTRWLVSEDEPFPSGVVTLTLDASDAGGDAHHQSLTFEVAELTEETDPFTRPMAWLLRFDLDLYSSEPDGRGGITSAVGANGVADFAEELEIIGARGAESAPGAATVTGRGQTGADAIFERWVIDAIIAEVRRYYHIAPDGTPRDGITIDFYVAGDPGAPDPDDFASDGDFSVMRFGGALDGAFGRSLFSVYNRTRVDDTTSDLGVGTAPLISTLATTAILVEDFYPIMPGIGIEVGDHPSDPIVLSDDFDRYALDNDPADNQRYDELHEIARQLGIAIAAVTAHEMGHGMGLVPNDAPPLGFFGNRGDVSFIGPDRTNSHHVDFPFVNLMQAGGNPLVVLNDALERVEIPDDYGIKDLLMVLAVENRLSPYSLGYFQRSQTYAQF